MSGFLSKKHFCLQESSGFNYYQSITDDEEEANNPKGNHLSAPVSGKQVVGEGLNNRGPNNVDKGLDYPFDEDGGGDQGKMMTVRKDKTKQSVDGGEKMSDITCNVNNGKYKIDCKKDSGSEVYIPFSFIHKYFEIYGKLEEPKEGEEQTFTWLHSFG